MAIELRGVSLKREHRVILRDVNISVNKGDFVAITGPNGGGKTSLLRIILGLLRPTSGSVELSPGMRIGYLPQKNMIDSHFPISVREVVKSGLLTMKSLSKEEKNALCDKTIELIGMGGHAGRPI
ncbi:MAG: ATP-binding cassette domain-containing protein, partial [Lachnospiraceae bacterium]|nr:ATP-binding cassette domain-containing protein [Lachnospiraceae bacterium]